LLLGSVPLKILLALLEQEQVSIWEVGTQQMAGAGMAPAQVQMKIVLVTIRASEDQQG